MASITNFTKRISLSLLITPLLIACMPVTSLAEELPGTTGTPESNQIPDATTYAYNEATGMWESDKYIWDPATRTTYPKDKLTYSYNPATDMWDTSEWVYNPESEKYEPNTAASNSKTTTDAPQNLQPAPSVTTATPPAANSNTLDTDSTFNGFYDASISNDLNSSAYSGNAAVSQNTSAGSATTGDASVFSTIFNILQSSAAIGDLSKVATFTTNVDGSVFGDLYIDPGIVATLQPADSTNLGSSLHVNNTTDGSINNTITVDAGSGNAMVNNNTSAGNATTGDADAVVNLVNLLNSSIASGQSFIGLLNINGSLNGDILLPEDSLDVLLAANSNPPQGSLTVTNTSNQNINNNLSVNAATGNATIADNTSAGSATTGDAATNITILNLTGQEVVGSNSLLVFVNVLGYWVGAILNAPDGSTAAALGGGITQHDNLGGDALIANTTNNTINNDVNVSARSGDATVSHNTNAGDARSGDATTSVNIANISNSSLALSDWFGILFINVFGIWNGSFGINTEAGGPSYPAPQHPPTNNAVANGPPAPSVPQVFRFVPTNNTAKADDDPATTVTAEDNENNEHGRILGTINRQDDDQSTPLLNPTQRDINLAVAAVIAGAVLVGIERLLAYRDNRRASKN